MLQSALLRVEAGLADSMAMVGFVGLLLRNLIHNLNSLIATQHGALPWCSLGASLKSALLPSSSWGWVADMQMYTKPQGARIKTWAGLDQKCLR